MNLFWPKNNFPDLINPQEFLKTITINGAKSLGLDDVCGTLEIGKLADLAIFEIYEDISNDPYSFISLPPEKRMLKAVYVEGQKIFEDGQFEYLDEELINHEVQKRKLIPQ